MTAIAVQQTVSHYVCGGICVNCRRRDADHCSDHYVLIDGIDCRVRVDRSCDRKLIRIDNRDGETLICNGTVRRRCSNRYVASRSICLSIDSPRHRDDSGARVDGEATAVVILQRVIDQVGRCIRVSGQSCNSNNRAHGGVFDDGIRGRIGICHRADCELIHVRNADRKCLSRE